MKYYFPIRGERYVPSKAHAVVEIIECIEHDTKLAVFATYNEASEAGRKMLFDDDTFVVFCLDNDCGQLQLDEVHWKNPDQRHGDYIWVCKEILEYIHL